MGKKIETKSDEDWKDIRGYEGLYQVSNNGRIKSLPKYNSQKEIILKSTENKRDGRLSVMLCRGPAERERITVHRLVAIAFINNPHNLKEVNHKDENPKNNYVDNLEWCTRKYNMNYGTLPGRINNKNKKPVIGSNEKETIKLGYIREGRERGFDGAGILHSIKSGKKYKGLNWRYAND